MPTKITHRSPVAVAYATALLELADEHKQLEPTARELGALQELIRANPTFKLYLSDPAIGHAERGELIQRVMGKAVSPLVGNFLRVLNEKGRLGILDEIADAYDELLDQRLGKIEVDVTVAHRLPPDQLEEVRKRVSAALKKDAVVHQYVDEQIIGGMVLRVQDQLIDASVRAQLDAMRERLRAAAPK
jgi:F-type H+-transporting ATPase subunit delta